jgi:hypothetical protein
VVGHTCHLSYKGGINKRIIVQASLGKNARPYKKIIITTKAAEPQWFTL